MIVFSKEKIIFFERRLNEGITTLSGEDMGFRFLENEEFKNSLFYNKECSNEYCLRFENKNKCAALFYKDTIVTIAWISENPLRVDELNELFAVPENDIIIFDVSTLENFRGKGYYPLILNKVNEWAVRNGKSRSHIYSSQSNNASIRGIQKAGFRKSIEAAHYKIFGKSFIRKNSIYD